VRLSSWRRADRDIEFDPNTGRGDVIHLHSPRPDDAPISGFAESERGIGGTRRFFAVYRERDDIFFNAGPQRWRLGTLGLRFEHDRRNPFVSGFLVTHSGELAFAFSYTHLGRLLLALADPTHDRMDQEADFFLGFIAAHASSPEWLQNVRERWTSAV
jgi:hypothetical protein